MADSQLSDREEKYCSCVLQVASKNPERCNRLVRGAPRGRLPTRMDGEVCAHPYAVCAKSTGTTSSRCSANYDYLRLSDAELRGYAALHELAVPKPYDRAEQLKVLAEYKRAELRKGR